MSDQAPPGLYQAAPGQPPAGGSPQFSGGDDDSGNPLPGKKHHWVRNAVLGVLGVLVIVIVIAVATSGGGSTTPSGTTGTPAARGKLPARAASPTTGIGASFAARDRGGQTYRVRLDLIMDPAPPADKSATPRHGTRFVGVVFTIKAISGHLRNGRVRRDATVVGSNGMTYAPVASPAAGYTGFRHGRIDVARGDSETGSATFQMPAGVTVSTVKWSAAPGSGSPIRWPV